MMPAHRTGSRWAVRLCGASLGIAFAAGAGLAQSISGVNGSASHGSTLTIHGSAFGTKPNAAPIKFDNFESGTPGLRIAGRPATVGGAWHTNSTTPYYSTAAASSGSLGMVADFSSGAYNSSLVQYADFSSGFYLDFWYRLLPANPASRNNKLFLLYGSNPNGDLPQVHFVSYCDQSASMELASRANNQTYSSHFVGVTQASLTGGELKHIQVWLKPSTPGVRDGIYQVYRDGELKGNFSNAISYLADGYVWNHVRIGYYMGHDGVEGCPPSGDAYAYWDDIYIDNTQARVELGNAATYSACTQRAIQIPTAWSPTAVSIQFNRGKFVIGSSSYLFVVTANGSASPGYPVTVTSSDGQLAPGLPGKPVIDGQFP